jgi:hypothetical protein
MNMDSTRSALANAAESPDSLVGEFVEVDGICCMVLDDYSLYGNSDDVFLITVDPIAICTFGETNNYKESRAKKIVDDWLDRFANIPSRFVKWNTLDLRTVNGEEDYGVLTTKAGILTLDEYRDYSSLISTLPCNEDGIWLATGWNIAPNDINVGLAAYSCGLKTTYCDDIHGVHPTIVVPKDMVQLSTTEVITEEDDAIDLSRIPTNVLLGELAKRAEANE